MMSVKSNLRLLLTTTLFFGVVFSQANDDQSKANAPAASKSQQQQLEQHELSPLQQSQTPSKSSSSQLSNELLPYSNFVPLYSSYLAAASDEGDDILVPLNYPDDSDETGELESEDAEDEDNSLLEYPKGDDEKRFQNRFIGKRFQNRFIGKRFKNRFLGKRFENRFIGKRFQNRFIGKRFQNRFIGKRFQNRFIGKRFQNRFIGKRFKNRFLGKRFENRFIGKRFGNRFVGKRFQNRFIGKRFKNRFIGKRFENRFIGKRAAPTIEDIKRDAELINDEVSSVHSIKKRAALRRSGNGGVPRFVGKRDRSNGAPRFIGKRQAGYEPLGIASWVLGENEYDFDNDDDKYDGDEYNNIETRGCGGHGDLAYQEEKRGKRGISRIRFVGRRHARRDRAPRFVGKRSLTKRQADLEDIKDYLYQQELLNDLYDGQRTGPRYVEPPFVGKKSVYNDFNSKNRLQEKDVQSFLDNWSRQEAIQNFLDNDKRWSSPVTPSFIGKRMQSDASGYKR